ncbi:MAG: site-2 protease family protein [Candidatus Saccharimonadales bacterium]
MNIDLVYILSVLVAILISMTLHEAAHAFVGYWLGDNTAKLQGRLTLNPLKHIDPFMSVLLPLMLAIAGAPIFGGAKPVPFNPNNVRGGEWGPALIAIAGPLTNFVIAFIAFGAWTIVGGLSDMTLLSEMLITIVYVNLGFFIFNLIPIPPLDGSRVIYALAPEFFRRWMEKAENFGLIFIFTIILVFGNAFGEFMANLISLFLSVFSRIFLA